jgi:hypothetical protein
MSVVFSLALSKDQTARRHALRYLFSKTQQQHFTAVLYLLSRLVKGYQKQALRLCMFYFLFRCLLKKLPDGQHVAVSCSSRSYTRKICVFYFLWSYLQKMRQTRHILLSSKIPRCRGHVCVSLFDYHCGISILCCSSLFLPKISEVFDYVLLSGFDFQPRASRSQLIWLRRYSPKLQHQGDMLCRFSSLVLPNIT